MDRGIIDVVDRGIIDAYWGRLFVVIAVEDGRKLCVEILDETGAIHPCACWGKRRNLCDPGSNKEG